ncbi:MAG: DNA mismatch repair protein MutS [Alphaproteobacteria bacterium]|nr:DNA mismatch repair protein MutS [Alphaproteobacteria bacterium]
MKPQEIAAVEEKPMEPEMVLTPMMQQYHQIKQEYPDCLLFYRMGDFYELFFEDAVQASAVLGITLTRRGKAEGQDIPMCGVPIHAGEGYMARLIKAGFRVAICEQMESPQEAKLRGAKSVVKRDVVRVVTAGTLTEENLLDATQNNFLAVICEDRGQKTVKSMLLSIAAVDMSTGDFFVESVNVRGLAAALMRLRPSEIVLSEELLQVQNLFETFEEWKMVLRPLPQSRFDPKNAAMRLKEIFHVEALDGFGNFSTGDITAAAALIDYVQLTQKGGMPRLNPPHKMTPGHLLEIDAATQRNLEIMTTLQGERTGSLLTTINRCVTHSGARLLARRLAMPSAIPAVINRRLDTVEFFAQDQVLRQEIRRMLKDCPDLERSLSRLALNRGGPRDLAAIRDGLAQTITMRRVLSAYGDKPLTPDLQEYMVKLGFHSDIVERLQRALAESLPVYAREGNFIAQGYLRDLDEKRELRDQGRNHIVALQEQYVKATGVSSLKIKHNNMLGYFIEVTSTHADKMGSGFIPRQSLSTYARYTTTELAELERNLQSAAEKAMQLEIQLFNDLVQEILMRADDIATTAQTLAEIDVGSALAELASQENYCKPVVDDSLAFSISGGRHPVVESMRKRTQNATFIANDCQLQEMQKLWLITGPNMAGKSTFLRQNALITILAQMGSFVPANAAHIGVVDRLFSRVGAADDLARGRSTFMVEMIETAAILNQATERSLVILDEVGRGTSTFDGVSIAWATVEHIHNQNKCRSLFATHYHELTDLEVQLKHVKCYTMKIKEWQGDVVFLHQVIPGAADRSYGLYVAKLAGIPKSVLHRAQDVLSNLENNAKGRKIPQELPLFTMNHE